MSGVSTSIITSFYPSDALLRGVSISRSGIVISALYIITMVFSLLFSRLIPVFGSRILFILGPFTFGIGNLVFGIVDKVEDGVLFFTLSVCFRVLIGLGDSAAVPASYNLAEKEVSPKNRGKTLTMLEFWFGVGSALGPSIGGYLYDAGGFSLPFIVTGISTLVTSCAYLFSQTESEGQSEDSMKTSSISSSEYVSVTPAVASLIFATAAQWWYAATLAPFLKTTHNFTASQTGLILLMRGLTYTVAAPCVGLLVDIGIGNHTVILLGNLLIAAAYILIAPIPQLIPLLGTQIWVTTMAVGVQGVGYASVCNGALLHLTEKVGFIGSSIWLAVVCFGIVVGSTLGSFASEQVGFQAASSIFLRCLIGQIIIFTMFLVADRVCISTSSFEAASEEIKKPLLISRSNSLIE